MTKAERLGREAYHNNVKAIPCLDIKIMKLLEGLKVGEGIKPLEAWMKGWNNENIRSE